MSGVTPVLQQFGWRDGGNFIMTPQGPYNALPEAGKAENEFYTVTLPSRAPILVQARILNTYLQRIYAQRQEPLILVGHSSGGVIARTWLVTSSSVPVTTLVTIASPHLGTPLADMADNILSTPVSTAADVMGLEKWSGDAENFYTDLRTERPGRFLYWLNHQPHPAIRYVSIVRKNRLRPDKIDFVVPDYSENMNNVAALRGHSAVITVDNSHFTNARDGYAVANILNNL